MTALRLLCSSLVVAAMLLPVTSVYHAHGTPATQKKRAAPQKRAARFHYVCPMHADVTSKKRGTCPKCKMAMVRKRVPKDSESQPESEAQHQH